MQQIDEFQPRRLRLLEETLQAVRALLGGETLNVEGEYVRLRNVELEHQVEVVPQVLVGTTGPKGLAVAGRSSEGVVIPEVACPNAVRWVREQTSAAGSAGRTVVYSYLSLDDDADAAVSIARPLVDRWISSGVFPDMAEQAGLARDGEGELSDETLQSIAAAGNPADCAATVKGLWDAGADSVVLLPRAEGSKDQLRQFSERSLPLLRADGGG
jgi:alkanesulfonate monooxygenase SsuD/methylene tetrahydromethanopterin reductase-like flavin-dependent oxidoreductase (luciferase family)